ncbi:hypothetical protein DS742_07910 [Lacrimispora amygdalina]|uniref:Uncharacterized protein n=1 Tax=Lacrimispora amygdalina TaxID=253257 RepID=A0A3E2NEQ4_9FIRM|nr:hypothetical protein DS742_07910 [Clostridium indicum]
MFFFALTSGTEQKSFSSVQLVNAPGRIFIANFLKKFKKNIFFPENMRESLIFCACNPYHCML